MLHFHGKFSLYHWLTISLILHAGIIIPFIFIDMNMLNRQTHNRLLIELFGMISNRQQEEKKGGGGPPKKMQTLHKPEAPKQHKKVESRKPAPTPETNDKEREDTSYAEKTDDKLKMTDQAIEPAGKSNASIPAVLGGRGDGVSQRRQSIGYGGQDTDKIRSYLARLGRRLQANLVYPEEMRKHGVEGTTTIRFTIAESGFIKDGSLRVHKSSGYAALDSNALKVARASAPFENPPKELNVTIAVAFTVEAEKSKKNKISTR